MTKFSVDLICMIIGLHKRDQRLCCSSGVQPCALPISGDDARTQAKAVNKGSQATAYANCAARLQATEREKVHKQLAPHFSFRDGDKTVCSHSTSAQTKTECVCEQKEQFLGSHLRRTGSLFGTREIEARWN